MPDKITFAWPADRRRIEQATNYWLATTRPDGRPHAAPVWGVWLGGGLYFPTDPNSVKGRNLLANTNAVVHLDDGADVLILEGVVSRAHDQPVISEVDDAMAAKYVVASSGAPYRLEMDPANVVWTLTPTKALAWWEPATGETVRRWLWQDGSGADPVAG